MPSAESTRPACASANETHAAYAWRSARGSAAPARLPPAPRPDLARAPLKSQSSPSPWERCARVSADAPIGARSDGTRGTAVAASKNDDGQLNGRCGRTKPTASSHGSRCARSWRSAAMAKAAMRASVVPWPCGLSLGPRSYGGTFE